MNTEKQGRSVSGILDWGSHSKLRDICGSNPGLTLAIVRDQTD
jgi:hypothetical protein